MEDLYNKNYNDVLEVLLSNDIPNKDDIIINIIKYHSVTHEMYEKLLNYCNDKILLIVASNLNCPSELLEKLYNNSNYHIRESVASNPNCSAHILENILNDKDWCVREILASNLNCPVHILEKLLNDNDVSVRYSVASNPNCPISILEKLSNSENSHIGESVASNPNCPAHILEKLSNDDDWKIRKSVASNPNCPVHILEKLLNDNDVSVRCSVASNPKCPISILEKLSNDVNTCVRKYVAKNPNCPVELLNKLSYNSNSSVRESVASNRNCSVEILKRLSNDIESGVREIVASNPNCSVDILKKLSNSINGKVRKYVAINPSCPVEILEILSKDISANVRTFVASNPNCTFKIFEKLLNDKSDDVVSSAIKNSNFPFELLAKYVNLVHFVSFKIKKVNEIIKDDKLKQISELIENLPYLICIKIYDKLMLIIDNYNEMLNEYRSKIDINKIGLNMNQFFVNNFNNPKSYLKFQIDNLLFICGMINNTYDKYSALDSYLKELENNPGFYNYSDIDNLDIKNVIDNILFKLNQFPNKTKIEYINRIKSMILSTKNIYESQMLKIFDNNNINLFDNLISLKNNLKEILIKINNQYDKYNQLIKLYNLIEKDYDYLQNKDDFLDTIIKIKYVLNKLPKDSKEKLSSKFNNIEVEFKDRICSVIINDEDINYDLLILEFRNKLMPFLIELYNAVNYELNMASEYKNAYRNMNDNLKQKKERVNIDSLLERLNCLIDVIQNKEELTHEEIKKNNLSYGILYSIGVDINNILKEMQNYKEYYENIFIDYINNKIDEINSNDELDYENLEKEIINELSRKYLELLINKNSILNFCNSDKIYIK